MLFILKSDKTEHAIKHSSMLLVVCDLATRVSQFFQVNSRFTSF